MVVVFEFSGNALPAPYAGVSFLKAGIIKIEAQLFLKLSL
ncbi:hypothetical protein VCSRO155_3504 [Vibrio cholerae]|nr:hypothetical protein VC87395_003441 [Vibrio paracholerae 87395]GHW32604.1 hypothetical protein VCSRO193_3538 [Vibrio cholerae]GHX02284.1 hypothetical protein VCSRO155_3504 [Vibrio cholerae]GHX44545.1 hypothetical protein VCSRO108_3476 [Vibrio cholerae]GHZ43411.1 hypothetical protein VCSRO173_3439 [Vibrio cholerae]